MSRAGSGGEMDGDFKRKRAQQLRDLERQGIDPFANGPQEGPVSNVPTTASSETTAGIAALADMLDLPSRPLPAPAPAPVAGVLEIDKVVTIPLAMPLSMWKRVTDQLSLTEDTEGVADAVRTRIQEEIES